MAVVEVRVPAMWFSTSPTAMSKAVGIMHVVTDVAEYQGRSIWADATLEVRPPLPGEHYVRTACGKRLDATPYSAQQIHEHCKLCAKAAAPDTILVAILPPVGAFEEAVKQLDADERQARNARNRLLRELP